jgi:hypothetical protein
MPSRRPPARFARTGLTVKNLALRGIVNVDAGDAAGVIVFVFSAEYASGEQVSLRKVCWSGSGAINSITFRS